MTSELHSTILGSGAPLVILHGFLGMSDNWKTLGTKYAQHGFQVHLVDQRNHGRSFHAEEFDYEVLAKDLNRYLHHHNILKTNVLGHSMGGKTAMQFATAYGEKVDKLLIADIAPKHYPAHHHDIIKGLKTLNFEHIKSRGEADQKLSESISEIGIRQFLLKNLYWVNKGELGFRFNLEVLQYKMEEVGENILGYQTFDGPTLFLRGDRSEYVNDNDWPDILKHFPNASISTIANAGHWLHAENPTAFFKESLEFLNR